MKKALKIFLPILIIIIGILYFFKNELMLWSLLNKYETAPSSIYSHSDVPKEMCAEAQEQIFKAYGAKTRFSEESLIATFELIEFFRSCISKDKKPLDKRTFDVLMNIYSRAKKMNTHQKIAYFLKREDVNAFYKYFEMTQEKDWLFYDVTSYSPTKYPKLLKEYTPTEKDLWCKKVQPKIEAEFVALIESDTLIDGVRQIRLLEMYEAINCTDDPLRLRKLQFAAWSELLANLEKDFYASKNSKKALDFDDLINASHELTTQPKNELESTSFYTILGLEEAAGKELILYCFDFPIQSRIMCWKIVFFICNKYGSSIDKELLEAAKAWLKLVTKKYPDFPIEKEWKHQMGMAELAEVYREHGEF